jgi:hypothetical protein
VLFAVRYQPLSAANFASGPVTSSGPNIVRVGYANGGTFSFGFLIVNEGQLPVRIQDPDHRSEPAAGPGQARDGRETLRRQPQRVRSLPREVPPVHVGRRRSPMDRGSDALRELRSLRGGHIRDVHAIQGDLHRARAHEACLGPAPQGHRGGLASRLRVRRGPPDARWVLNHTLENSRAEPGALSTTIRRARGYTGSYVWSLILHLGSKLGRLRARGIPQWKRQLAEGRAPARRRDVAGGPTGRREPGSEPRRPQLRCSPWVRDRDVEGAAAELTEQPSPSRGGAERRDRVHPAGAEYGALAPPDPGSAGRERRGQDRDAGGRGPVAAT